MLFAICKRSCALAVCPVTCKDGAILYAPPFFSLAAMSLTIFRWLGNYAFKKIFFFEMVSICNMTAKAFNTVSGISFIQLWPHTVLEACSEQNPDLVLMEHKA